MLNLATRNLGAAETLRRQDRSSRPRLQRLPAGDGFDVHADHPSVAFDLMFLDGKDLRTLPIEKHRGELWRRTPRSPKSRLRFSEAIPGDGTDMWSSSSRHGLPHLLGLQNRNASDVTAGTDHPSGDQSQDKLRCCDSQLLHPQGDSVPRRSRFPVRCVTAPSPGPPATVTSLVLTASRGSPDTGARRLNFLSAEESEERIGHSGFRKAPCQFFITRGRADDMSHVIPSFPANETVHRVHLGVNTGISNGDNNLMGELTVNSLLSAISSKAWHGVREFGIARRL